MTKGFTVFGRILSAIAVVGLILQAVQMLTGWTILPAWPPRRRGCAFVGTIIFLMTGAMCLLTVLSRVLRPPAPVRRAGRWASAGRRSRAS